MHGFRSQYMNFQALYLDSCRSEVMGMLADNVTHPLNEYALLAVNFGIIGVTVIIGIAVIIVRYCLKHPSRDGFIGLSVMAGIAVLALFSYPFRYPLTSVALACALLLVFREPLGCLTDRCGKVVCSVSAVMSTVGLALFLADQESLRGRKEDAERLYRLAASMCPVRFAPLYGLFCLYEEQGRFDEMKSMGQAILRKRIKVQSAQVSRIRLAVRQRMMMNNL